MNKVSTDMVIQMSTLLLIFGKTERNNKSKNGKYCRRT